MLKSLFKSIPRAISFVYLVWVAIVSGILAVVQYNIPNKIFFAILVTLATINLLKANFCFWRTVGTVTYQFLVWSIFINCFWSWLGHLLSITFIIAYWGLYYCQSKEVKKTKKAKKAKKVKKAKKDQTIPWTAKYDKDGNIDFPEGIILEFRPLTWCYIIPQFWRKIRFINRGGTISVKETIVFFPSLHNLINCTDPDYDNTIWDGIIQTDTVTLERKGQNEKELRFRLPHTAAQDIAEDKINRMIVWTCEKQGFKRVGHS